MEAEGGENRHIITGHTVKMAGWAEHGCQKRSRKEQEASSGQGTAYEGDQEPGLDKKNIVGWALTQKTKNPGLLAGEGAEMGEDNQPLPLPMDIQDTRKRRRAGLLQEEQEQPQRCDEERNCTWVASQQKVQPTETSASSATESGEGKGRGGKRGHPGQDGDKEHEKKKVGKQGRH